MKCKYEHRIGRKRSSTPMASFHIATSFPHSNNQPQTLKIPSHPLFHYPHSLPSATRSKNVPARVRLLGTPHPFPSAANFSLAGKLNLQFGFRSRNKRTQKNVSASHYTPYITGGSGPDPRIRIRSHLPHPPSYAPRNARQR